MKFSIFTAEKKNQDFKLTKYMYNYEHFLRYWNSNVSSDTLEKNMYYAGLYQKISTESFQLLQLKINLYSIWACFCNDLNLFSLEGRNFNRLFHYENLPM